MTAAAAVEGIRRHDAEGGITLFSNESVPPYDRPPLTKGLWTGDDDIDDIWCGVEADDADLQLGKTIAEIRPGDHEVTDRDGTVYRYEKLLVATGGTPRKLPFGGENILYYRTYADYRTLRDLAEKKKRFLVIGGGFIGSELAAALSMQDRDVTIVFPETGICGLTFPVDLAEAMNIAYRDRGVTVCRDTKPKAIEKDGATLRVALENGKTVEVDAIVAGIGISPNTDLAEQAGLEVDNGILVDSGLLTTAPDIYAAGDVANFYNPLLKTRMRVEHEDNANTMGEAAGKAMAGDDSVSYDYLPMFYSDLFDYGYEAIGRIDAELQVIEHWIEPHEKGAVFYLRDNRVRGALFWNVWDMIDPARELLGTVEFVDKDDLDKWLEDNLNGD
jgi:NADPH-dependent 2,4-dienoyl-CoA reductase/sulfur reductase-like enzyme